MTEAEVKKLVQNLESIRNNPRVAIFDMVPPVLNWLSGFYFALSSTSLHKDYYRHYDLVRKEHGWDILAKHPIDQMVEKGMEEKEIIEEALTLEIETWKRIQCEM